MSKVVESYDKIAPEYESVLGYSYMFLKDEIDAFFKSLTPGSRILDAGCGPGFESEVASQIGLNVTGLDFSPKMIERFAARLPNSIGILGSLTNIPAESNSFDAIFTSCALLHLDKVSGGRAIDELFRVLKLGGTGFVGTSISKGEVDLHTRPAFQKVGVNELYFYHWHLEEFSARLVEAGFKILSVNAKPIIENRPTFMHFTVKK